MSEGNEDDCSMVYLARRRVRPVRKTESILKDEQRDELLRRLCGADESDFEVRRTEKKGRGVFTRRSFERGEFVLELTGDVITAREARRRESEYADSSNSPPQCYMIYFKHSSKSYGMDATEESGRLGRLVNHSRRNFNLTNKVIMIDETPRLLLFAVRKIERDEELLYDYGDRNPQSIREFPWLAT